MKGLTQDEAVEYARLRVRLVKADREKLDRLVDSLLARVAQPLSATDRLVAILADKAMNDD